MDKSALEELDRLTDISRMIFALLKQQKEQRIALEKFKEQLKAKSF